MGDNKISRHQSPENCLCQKVELEMLTTGNLYYYVRSLRQYKRGCWLGNVGICLRLGYNNILCSVKTRSECNINVVRTSKELAFQRVAGTRT